MKITLYLVLFICLIKSIALANSYKNKIEYDLTFSEEDAKSISNKLADIECAKTPLKTTCPSCIKGEDQNIFLHYYSLIRHKKFHYKFLIQFNDVKQKIYVYFNSPIFNKNNHIYFKKYFLEKIPVTEYKGFSINVEVLYLYQKYFKSKLYSSLERLFSSNRGKFTIVFAGNSLGGSLATFAAYDVAKNYENLDHKNIEVYSFNSLVITDNKFADEIPNFIKVHRIYKEDDFLIYPNCIFNKKKSIWLCKNEKLQFVNKNYIFQDKSSKKSLGKSRANRSVGDRDKLNKQDNTDSNNDIDNNPYGKMKAQDARKNVQKELKNITINLKKAKKDYYRALRKSKKDPKNNPKIEEALDRINDSEMEMRKASVMIKKFKKSIENSLRVSNSDSLLDEELDEEKEAEKEKSNEESTDFLSYAQKAIATLKKATKIIKKRKAQISKEGLVNGALAAMQELTMATKNYEKEKKKEKKDKKEKDDLINNIMNAVGSLNQTKKIIEYKKYIKIKDDTPVDEDSSNDHTGFKAPFIQKSKRKTITFKVEKYGDIYLYDSEMETYRVCETKTNNCVIKIKPFPLITKYSNSVLYNRQLGICDNKKR